eukprot:g5532.t1
MSPRCPLMTPTWLAWDGNDLDCRTLRPRLDALSAMAGIWWDRRRASSARLQGVAAISGATALSSFPPSRPREIKPS